MARELHELKVDEIKRMIVNYDNAGVVTGGKWSRAELLLEIERRKTTVYEIIKLARLILDGAQRSETKRITYKQLYEVWHNKPPPVGYSWVGQLTGGLEVLGIWCFDRDLPLINILVVNATTGEVKEETVEKMWEAAKERGKQVPG